MTILHLTLKSLNNRRGTAMLTLFSIALSTALLLGVERIRSEARNSFANTISATDLVVGARGGAMQLLLYSVFHIGNATNNISWKSYQEIIRHPKVSWTVPLALGDSHHGFRVLGTTSAFFEHYRYSGGRSLEFHSGHSFSDLYDAVIGADVAEKLGYRLGQGMVVAHGAGKISIVQHADKPFRVVGILQRTGTPVDRTVLVSLEAIEAIHIDWQGGMPSPGVQITAEKTREMNLTPRSITAALVGLKSRVAVFQVQRFVNDYNEEALSAIMPGVALQELWDLMGIAENALRIISWAVVLVGVTGMLNAILSGLNERRRELAILRSVGARPWQISILLAGEAGTLSLVGAVSGMGLLHAAMFLLAPMVASRFGLSLGDGLPTTDEWQLLGLVVVAGVLVGIIPAWRAYRLSLADGMTIRI
ncbi:MAG: ABC transporter permease [Magnetococcales bacterium]|nr:ABC transporter permease [Magnetococcales bacterium]